MTTKPTDLNELVHFETECAHKSWYDVSRQANCKIKIVAFDTHFDCCSWFAHAHTMQWEKNRNNC